MSRRKRMLEDLDREIREHIARETQDNLERGMSPEEARQAARRAFGNVMRVKEQTRAVWSAVWLEELAQDLRYGLRLLRRSPGFTFVAVVTLALGIGVNTSVFSLLYSLALRPLPVKDPASLVSVYQDFRGPRSRGVYGMPSLLSYPEYVNYRDGNHVFSGLAAYADVSLSLGGTMGQTAAGLLASCNYFEVLGGELARGRGFSAEDCGPASVGSTAVISSGYWKNHFHSDPAVLGRALTLNRQVFTVVGVAGSNFAGTELEVPDVWIPLTAAPRLLPNEFGDPNWLALGNVSWLSAVGRLKPGISHRQAEGELDVLARRLDANYPGRQTLVSVNSGAYLNSPEIRSVGAWVAAAILALAGFILLIACMNVMNLLLARATARYQEMGIRLALGASRLRLVRQLLAETVLLALLGGAASVVVAQWLPPLLVRAVPEMPTSFQGDLTPNFAILAYAFLASLLAAAACGLAPALQSTKRELVSSLKEEGSPVSRRLGRSRLRGALIAGQVAGCTVLLVATGLLVRGVRRAETASPGFLTKNVIVVTLDLASQGYDDPRAAALERELHDRLAAIPGVAGVARSATVPCLTGNMTGVTIPGSQADGGPQLVWANIVSADYFQTMGIPLLRGRTFTEPEALRSGPVPAIISAAMARRFWRDTDPVGKDFLGGKTAYRIFGIAPDVQNAHLGQTDGPYFYGASGTEGALDAKLFVRTAGGTAGVAAAIPRLARQLDANVTATTETLEHALEKLLTPSRTLAFLVAVLGLLAMVLAVVGVWGIVAYAASRRAHEIGIRKALGAQPRDILALLLRQGTKLATIGVVIGLALGAAASQLLRAAGLLFGLSAFDPATYLATGMALAGATLLAGYLPARRAMRVDSMVALRYE